MRQGYKLSLVSLPTLSRPGEKSRSELIHHYGFSIRKNTLVLPGAIVITC